MATEEMVYSVWAMPQPDQQALYKEVMSKLIEKFGGPVFEPHVTVAVHTLPLPKAMACLEAACTALPPYICNLKTVGKGTFFYQCVFMLAETTQAVLDTHFEVGKSFGLLQGNHRPDPYEIGYMPHLSLLYADLSEEDKEKARLFVEEEYGSALCGSEFKVTSLCLYKTDTSDKSLKSWEKVAEYPLGNSSA